MTYDYMSFHLDLSFIVQELQHSVQHVQFIMSFQLFSITAVIFSACPSVVMFPLVGLSSE